MKPNATDNGWSGGQYSVYRSLFGLYLLVHFIQLLPWSEEVFSSSGMLGDATLSPLLYLFPNILAVADNPLMVDLLVSSAALASLFFLVGYRDKIAAVWIFFVLACLFSRNPLIANPSLPYVGWMLLAHLFIPSAPFGSVEYLMRNGDQTQEWRFPKDVFLAAWIILALSYTYSGYTKLLSPSWVSGDNINFVLNNPLARDYFLRDFFLALPPILLKILTWSVLYIELLFAPLILIKRLRPVMWGLMLFIQFGFAFLLNFLDLTLAMLLMHFFTFDPAWLKGRACSGLPVLFYDGECGLCHGVVRFLLAEDKEQRSLGFGSLQGESFRNTLPQERRVTLPDSIVLILDNSTVLVKSAAVIYLLEYLGGVWKLLGKVLWLIPRPIRDLGYDAVGAIRNQLFKKPDTLCPIVPPALASRFRD